MTGNNGGKDNMNKRNIAKQATLLLQFSVLILALSGCGISSISKVSLTPVTGYPHTEKINLKVQLMLTEEMCTALWHMNYDYDDGKEPSNYLSFPLGDDFCLNTRKIANILFTDVMEKRNSSPVGEIDAILTPQILTLIRNRPPTAGKEQTTTIIVEWSLKDKKGNIIWVDTITAQGKAALVETQKQVQNLFNDLFHKSINAISSSVEIRRFSLTRNR